MRTLHLPFPPTANNLFFNLKGRRGGRAPTPKYEAWQLRAAIAVRRQAPEAIAGPIKLSIFLGRPDRRRRDLSNYIKALEDTLVKMSIIEDDSMVQSLKIEWGSQPGAVLTIERWVGEQMGKAA